MKDFVGSKPKRQKLRSKASNSKNNVSVSRSVRKIMGLSLVILVVFLVILIFSSLPWADIFTGQTSETVLFVTEQVEQTGAFLIKFDFTVSQVDVYPIPSELPMEVLGGYGNYRFQAVYPLLKLEGQNISFIRSTLSLSTGILLDELWPINTDHLQLDKSARLKTFFLQNFWQNLHIPLKHKLSWLGLVLDRRSEIIIHEPLTKLPISTLPNSKVSSSELLCTVALVNTTSLNGLAGRIENLLENHNFRVVRTTSDDTLIETTTVISEEDLSDDCQQVFDKILKLVPGKVVQQQNSQETSHYRADLVVKLGTDLVW
ncbi:MAG: LytR C-terminal domain-containing protein [Candidatus Paceibacterota bacterium]